jgi:uncharacterized protein YdgA (DUF945 family)
MAVVAAAGVAAGLSAWTTCKQITVSLHRQQQQQQQEQQLCKQQRSGRVHRTQQFKVQLALITCKQTTWS